MRGAEPTDYEQYYDKARVDASIEKFDDNNSGFFALVHAFREASKLRDLANLYTVLDRDHRYYIGSKTGLITAYADEDPNDSRSKIIKGGEYYRSLECWQFGPPDGPEMCVFLQVFALSTLT